MGDSTHCDTMPRFSDVFSGCRKRPVVGKGLILLRKKESLQIFNNQSWQFQVNAYHCSGITLFKDSFLR